MFDLGAGQIALSAQGNGPQGHVFFFVIDHQYDGNIRSAVDHPLKGRKTRAVRKVKTEQDDIDPARRHPVHSSCQGPGGFCSDGRQSLREPGAKNLDLVLAGQHEENHQAGVSRPPGGHPWRDTRKGRQHSLRGPEKNLVRGFMTRLSAPGLQGGYQTKTDRQELHRQRCVNIALELRNGHSFRGHDPDKAPIDLRTVRRRTVLLPRSQRTAQWYGLRIVGS